MKTKRNLTSKKKNPVWLESKEEKVKCCRCKKAFATRYHNQKPYCSLCKNLQTISESLDRTWFYKFHRFLFPKKSELDYYKELHPDFDIVEKEVKQK